MVTSIKVIKSILIMCCIMVGVDLYLSYSHEKLHGPYKYATAQIKQTSSWCQRNIGSTGGNYEVELVINKSTYKTTTPFIGLYPMRLCLFGTYIPLYDYNKLAKLKAGDNIQVIITNDNKIYLGRTAYLFNIITVVILLFGFFSLKHFKKLFKPTLKTGAV